MPERLTWLTGRRFKRLAMLMVVGFSFLFLGLTLLQSWGELSRYSWRFDSWYLVVAALAYIIDLGLAAKAWNSVMRGLGGSVGLRRDTKFYCSSNIANRLPTPVWYIGGRIYLYDQAGVPMSVTSSGAILEYLLITLAGTGLTLILLPMSAHDIPLATLAIMAAVLAVLLTLFVQPRWFLILSNWFLRRLKRLPLDVEIRRYDLALWYIWYTGVWLGGGIMLYLLTNTVYPLPLEHLPATMGVWAASGVASRLAFFTPNGLGLRDITLAWLLGFYIPLPAAIVVAILARIWIMVGELVGLLLSVIL